MPSAVYTITHVPTNRIYVGSAVDVAKRWREHVRKLNSGRGSRYLQRAWDKHGSNEFSFDVVIICSKDELIVNEQMMIDALRSWDAPYGFNHVPTAGSQLGFRHDAETKSRISATQKGKVVSQETRDKIRAARIGLKRPASVGEKIRMAKCGKPNLKLRGVPKSPEHRAALAAAKKGRSLSEEHKSKIAISMMGNTNGKGIPHTESHKENIAKGLRQAYDAGRRPRLRPGSNVTES